jgi:hypothetical protein
METGRKEQDHAESNPFWLVHSLFLSSTQHRGSLFSNKEVRTPNPLNTVDADRSRTVIAAEGAGTQEEIVPNVWTTRICDLRGCKNHKLSKCTRCRLVCPFPA